MVQPVHKPTEETRTLVQIMASHGLSHDEIIQAVGIGSKHTLYKYYREDVDKGMKMASVMMAKALYDKGMGKKTDGDTKAMMFWLERVGGDIWKQNQKVEVTSQDYKIKMSPVLKYLDAPTEILDLENDDTN